MLAAILRLMRPGDWVKNVFVLPALLFALPTELAGRGETGLPPLLAATGLAFAAFCLIASGFYCINDALDAESDRRHPEKRDRPVARGDVSPRAAVLAGVVLAAAGLGTGALVNVALLVTLALYAVLQVLYNARLKRVMLVDVVTVALGFALRAAAGAVAIEIPISVWLLLCVFFLCLYLGFVKRLCDLVAAEHEAGTTWHSPAGYRSRHELDWLLGVSGVLAVVTYLMYAMSAHAWRLFGLRAFGFAVMTPLVLIAMHRFYRRAGLGSSDSPLAALREDRIVLASITLFVAGTVLSLYAPGLDTLFGKVFVSVHGTAGP